MIFAIPTATKDDATSFVNRHIYPWAWTRTNINFITVNIQEILQDRIFWHNPLIQSRRTMKITTQQSPGSATRKCSIIPTWIKLIQLSRLIINHPHTNSPNLAACPHCALPTRAGWLAGWNVHYPYCTDLCAAYCVNLYVMYGDQHILKSCSIVSV